MNFNHIDYIIPAKDNIVVKSIAFKFKIPDITTVNSTTKKAITDKFKNLSQHKIQEIWKPYLPPREKVSVEIQGCCVTIMDDWECAIFGSSLVDCLTSLSLMHQFLNGYFNRPVSFTILDTTPGNAKSVDALIAKEKRRNRLYTILKFVGTAIISGLIGYLIKLFFS